jgi:hypothetical protein
VSEPTGTALLHVERRAVTLGACDCGNVVQAVTVHVVGRVRPLAGPLIGCPLCSEAAG